jgi:hypothetical protein
MLKIFVSCTFDKGLISRIYWELKRQIDDLVEKCVNELKRAFSREKVQMLKTHEDMFNIPGHKGNANQHHVKILPHSCYNGNHQEHKQQQILEGMWGKRTPCTLLAGM